MNSSVIKPDWISGFRRYLALITVVNLSWEFLHMPLYQIWETGSVSEIVFAAIHCTGGDVLIALSSLIAALILFGDRGWPVSQSWKVIVTTVLFGFLYTMYSEWLNIEVRKTWAYRDLMPVIPVINMGLSPALQWLIIPLLGFWCVKTPWMSKKVP